MQCDVRQTDDEGMIEAFKQFKDIKPDVAWSQADRPSLFFKHKGREFRINYFYDKRAKCEYYPNVDNIRFDKYIRLPDWILEIIKKHTKAGYSIYFRLYLRGVKC